ncbi:MAG TPA: trehalose-phosphatase [Acidimicrobiales bacterium]|nr:trehalose-phosphatase [Acidimicrobiales bacterium]
MTVAPSSASLDALLAPFLAAPERAGVLTDFDGTLSPIVEDPASARPLPEAVDVLHRLSARYGRVAVVSGRPAAFLSARLRLARAPGLIASGLYGMEYAQGDQITTNPRAEEWRAVVHEVACEAEEQSPPEVHVERKGLSLTLHYRTCPEHAVWVRTWTQAAAARSGLLLHPARMSDELRPPVEIDKGTVVAELAAGLSAVCFLGDDVGDLPAFAALDRLHEQEGVATLKVVVTSPEAPRALIDEGDVVVDSPAAALDVLERLLA